MSLRKARLERKVKQKSLIRFALLAVAAVLALGLLYQLGVNVHSTIIAISRNIKVVDYGCLEDKLAGKAIVINQEEPVLAPTQGSFENMVKEKEKVSKGELLGYFVGAQGKTPLQAQQSGIFVSNTDGLEETFRAMSLQEVTPEVFAYETSPAAANNSIDQGQEVFKIVDSLQPTRLLMQFPLNEVNFAVQNQQSVKILLTGQDLGKAIITGMKQDSKNLFIEFECTGFQDELLNRRYVELEVIFNSYNGYLIPEKAIVEKAGKKGIYCSNDEDIKFKPVTIIKTKNNMAVVEGLNKNDLLVNNPPHPAE